MAHETTAAKRCETCGRLGACPSLRKGKLIDLTGMKMENTPGYCSHWVDGDKFKFALPNPGAEHEADRGTPLMIYERDAAGNWSRAGAEKDESIEATAVSEPSHLAPSPSPQGEGNRLPTVDFKALDKLIDAGKIRELGKIEARIDVAKRQTMGALLEIGRCLNEAKERNLIPHGQFEQWAMEQTGMGERTRQRIMQAAREVPAGSAMERLDFTKTVTLLALPESEREELAEKAEAENMSLRKLQEEISKLTGELRQEKRNSDYYKSIREREKDEIEKKVKTITDAALDGEQAKLQVKYLEDEKQELLNEITTLKNNPPTQGISPEAQQMLDAHAQLIAKLSQQVKEAEDYAEQQESLRQKAQGELLRSKQQSAYGTGSDTQSLTGESLAEAVRMFMGTAGALPHMGPMLAKLTANERQAYQRSVLILSGWVQSAKQALDMVIGEGSISGREV